MKNDAQAHEEEDKKKRETVDAKNLAEQLIYTSEKAITDNKDKITDDIKKSVTEKVDALKKVKDGNDLEAIKKGTEELSKEAQKIGEYLSKNAQTNTGTQEAPKDSNVKDAEEVKDDNSEKK